MNRILGWSKLIGVLSDGSLSLISLTWSQFLMVEHLMKYLLFFKLRKENKKIRCKKVEVYIAYKYLHFYNRTVTLDTGRKLNVHKKFRRPPGCLQDVFCTFKLRLVSRGTSWSLLCYSNLILLVYLQYFNSKKITDQLSAK